MGHLQSQLKYSLAGTDELALMEVPSLTTQLTEKLEQLLAVLKHGDEVRHDGARPNASRVELAKMLYEARRLVDSTFDYEGFATSPAWDIMLDLYQSEAAGKPISVSSACIGAGCPPTTALRWLQAIEGMGFIERVDDPADKRRSFIMLTAKGRAATERALDLHQGGGTSRWICSGNPPVRGIEESAAS